MKPDILTHGKILHVIKELEQNPALILDSKDIVKDIETGDYYAGDLSFSGWTTLH